jgi:tetratricopeptide (TPR) repeat protein
MCRLLAVFRFALTGAGVLLLVACSTVPTPTTTPEQAQGRSHDAHSAAAASQEEAAPVETNLPADVLFHILTAEIAGQRGHLHTAVKQYLAAAKASRDPAVAERATRIAVYARDDASAREAAALWAQLQPHSIQAHQVAAAMYVREGNTKQAHDQLEKIIADSKRGDHHTFMLITSLLSKEKDKKVALQVMEQLIANRRDNPEALYAYAQLALLVGDLAKAEKAAQQVQRLRPAWADTHILMSNILYRQGHKVEAMASLKHAVESYPDNVVLRDYYARRLVDEKQYKEAREQFQVLLEKSPKNHEAEYALGLLSMQLHDLDGAEAHFQHLVDIRNRVPEASYYLGQITRSTPRSGLP